MVRYSLLDLVPITEGHDAAHALESARELAQHAEGLGFHRYWVAEHHGMPGIASAATSVVLAHVGAATSRIRIGAGGIMLPNHSPLVIAEQFGTLETLHPGRVDLGLGRAPGSDPIVARALRRHGREDPDAFPRDVVELLAYLSGEADLGVSAVPGAGTRVPVWILGSSTFGAQLAAQLGLPYAFASHFAPGALFDAVRLYRERFRPSKHLDAPYVMLGFNVFAAPTEEEARLLATSMQQAFVQLRTGRPGKLPKPVEGYRERLPPDVGAMLDHVLSASAIGGPSDVQAQLTSFVERTRPDELILASSMYEPAHRQRSLTIAAEALAAVAA